MRDVIVSLFILGLFPACFRKPFFGLIVFSWLAYMRVQDLTWGFARGQRWSFYVAIMMFAGFFINERRRFFMPDIRCWLMIILVLIIGVGVALSENPDLRQFGRYLEFVKIIGIALFTTAVVRTKAHLRALLWVIALSLGFYGMKAGLWGILTLGRTPILRGPGGMLLDNNDFSLALSMALPMLVHLGLSEKDPSIRRAFWLAVPLTIVATVMTHSRGGFLSLCACIMVLLWRSRNRLAGFSAGMLLAIAGVLLAPSSYKERIVSISEYETEGSAQSRLRTWGIALRMSAANPLMGVGFGKFRQHFLDYAPNPTDDELSGNSLYVAHSSYLQILAECGGPAFGIYLLLIGLSFWTIWSIRKEALQRYFSSWILNYAVMFEASMVAFLVGATFLNRAHFDLFYHWVAIILLFGYIAREEMKDTGAYPEKSVGRGTLAPARQVGFGLRPRRSGFGKAPA